MTSRVRPAFKEMGMYVLGLKRNRELMNPRHNCHMPQAVHKVDM